MEEQKSTPDLLSLPGTSNMIIIKEHVGLYSTETARLPLTGLRVVPSTTARSYSLMLLRTKKRETGAVRRTIR